MLWYNLLFCEKYISCSHFKKSVLDVLVLELQMKAEFLIYLLLFMHFWTSPMLLTAILGATIPFFSCFLHSYWQLWVVLLWILSKFVIVHGPVLPWCPMWHCILIHRKTSHCYQCHSPSHCVCILTSYQLLLARASQKLSLSCQSGTLLHFFRK